MLLWIIQITIMSIILVFLAHNLITFFTTTLTVPKIKDLVNTPAQKYENMMNIIKNNSKTYENDYEIVDLLPQSEIKINDTPTMKNELKSFLKKQLNNSGLGTEISALDADRNFNLYSDFN